MFDWFKKKSDQRELEAIFEKFIHFFESDEEQNKRYPPSVQSAINAGAVVDQIPGAQGEFGRTWTNPIPVNGSYGEIIYISSLRTSDGLPVIGHRVGSAKRIDAYELISIGAGSWDLLFFDAYHPRKSKLTPKGYTRTTTSFFSALNQTVDGFPLKLEEPLREFARVSLGNGALIPEQIKGPYRTKFPNWQHSKRPSSITAKIYDFRAGERDETPSVVKEAFGLITAVYNGERTMASLSVSEASMVDELLELLEEQGGGLVVQVIRGAVKHDDLSQERRLQIDGLMKGLGRRFLS